MFCKSCGKEVELHSYRDGDGDTGVVNSTRDWTVYECRECGEEEELYYDEDYTKKFDPAEYDPYTNYYDDD